MVFEFTASYIDRNHITGVVSDVSEEKAREQIMNHPQVAKVVDFRIDSIKNHGNVSDFEQPSEEKQYVDRKAMN